MLWQLDAIWPLDHWYTRKIDKTSHHCLHPTYLSLSEKEISRARDEFNREGIISVKCMSKWWGLNVIPEIVQIDRGLADDEDKMYKALDRSIGKGKWLTQYNLPEWAEYMANLWQNNSEWVGKFYNWLVSKLRLRVDHNIPGNVVYKEIKSFSHCTEVFSSSSRVTRQINKK